MYVLTLHIFSRNAVFFLQKESPKKLFMRVIFGKSLCGRVHEGTNDHII